MAKPAAEAKHIWLRNWERQHTLMLLTSLQEIPWHRAGAQRGDRPADTLFCLFIPVSNSLGSRTHGHGTATASPHGATTALERSARVLGFPIPQH